MVDEILCTHYHKHWFLKGFLLQLQQITFNNSLCRWFSICSQANCSELCNKFSLKILANNNLSYLLPENHSSASHLAFSLKRFIISFDHLSLPLKWTAKSVDHKELIPQITHLISFWPENIQLWLDLKQIPPKANNNNNEIKEKAVNR